MLQIWTAESAREESTGRKIIYENGEKKVADTDGKLSD